MNSEFIIVNEKRQSSVHRDFSDGSGGGGLLIWGSGDWENHCEVLCYAY